MASPTRRFWRRADEWHNRRSGWTSRSSTHRPKNATATNGHRTNGHPRIWGSVTSKWLRQHTLPGHGAITATATAAVWTNSLTMGQFLIGQGQLVATTRLTHQRGRGCATPGCLGQHHTKGRCQRCWRQIVRTGTAPDGPARAYTGQAPDRPPRMYRRQGCLVVGCPGAHHAGGYCRHHHDARRRGVTGSGQCRDLENGPSPVTMLSGIAPVAGDPMPVS